MIDSHTGLASNNYMFDAIIVATYIDSDHHFYLSLSLSFSYNFDIDNLIQSRLLFFFHLLDRRISNQYDCNL